MTGHFESAATMSSDLVEIVADYVRSERLNLASSYRWKVPKTVPFGVRAPAEGPLYLANRELRCGLAQVWASEPSKRLEIANWYVGVWGGVRANRDKTIAAYVRLAQSGELHASGVRGIASWSKVLTVSEPSRFAILDARVAAALNALQISCGKTVALFPRLASRNRIISDFNRAPRASSRWNGVKLSKREVYPAYLALLARAASMVGDGCDLQTAEMVLFAKAEALVMNTSASLEQR